MKLLQALNKRPYIFTFGLGQKYARHYVKIWANNAIEARKTMFKFYGDKWAFQYDTGNIKDLKYNSHYKLLKEIF